MTLSEELENLVREGIRVEAANIEGFNHASAILVFGLREVVKTVAEALWDGLEECPQHGGYDKQVLKKDTPEYHITEITSCLGRLRKSGFHVVAKTTVTKYAGKGVAELNSLRLAQPGEDIYGGG
jgi:hypothetical protein